MRKALPLNPKTEIFRWGPVPARFHFPSDWEGIFTVVPKMYPGEFWPRSLIIFKNSKRIVYINEFPQLRKQGASVFLKLMLSTKKRAKVWAGWQKDRLALNKVEKEIEKLSLKQLSLIEFINLWKKFGVALINFWSNVALPELAGYGADKILEKKLAKYIKDKTELASAMETLTAPEEPSFYQEEEIELSLAADLKKHAKKYFWLKNSYAGAEIAKEDFFAERKKELSANLKNKIEQRQKKVKGNKKFLQAKFKLPKEIMNMASALVKCVEWQDIRKKSILIYIHYKNLMLEEASRRLKIAKDDLLNFGMREVLKLLKGANFGKLIKERRQGFGFIFDKNGTEYVGPSLAKKYWEIYAEQKLVGQTNKIFGIIASKGFARGKVKIILNPMDKNDFQKSDILVAPMTTPEYVFLIKKSAAVVTDEGGLTSHAAVVSREFGIPCLVGTKIATRVLKDGQLVEVDANRGVVRIIK